MSAADQSAAAGSICHSAVYPVYQDGGDGDETSDNLGVHAG